MERPRSLEHVKFTKSKGKWYAYFNTGRKLNGKTVYAPMPPVGSPGFFDTYATYLGHRRRKVDVVLTVEALAREFEKSLKFRSLANASQVERRHIREIADERIESAGTRNMGIAGDCRKWPVLKASKAKPPSILAMG